MHRKQSKNSKLSSRRHFMQTVLAGSASAILTGSRYSFGERLSRSTQKTNFVVIFCDDLGYGDIGPFGSTLNNTPNLDRMALEGMRLTSFYVSSCVCSPSRSSLMTGCYAQRVDIHKDHNNHCVLFPIGKKGLNPNEITIAEILKEQGYATACIGKWHLGDQPEFLPTRQGFDYYFGIPYSNDMGERKDGSRPPLPIVRNETVVEAPAEQKTLTKRYTEEAVRFIQEHQNQPFFVYLPHSMPHVPIFASESFQNRSKNGAYGDVIEEIDWSVGQILQTLRDLELDSNTIVLFTSDNGATGGKGRSNKPLRGHKGTTWEGGMREPCIVWGPGRIPAGSESDELTTTLDILPTFARLAGSREPQDRVIDGKDIWPILRGDPAASSPRDFFYYYQMDQLQAVRDFRWKLHLPLKPKIKNWGAPHPEAPLQLFDLKNDIGEKNNVAEQHPEIVQRLLAAAEKARDELGDLNRPARGRRKAGWIDDPKPMVAK